MPLHPSCHSFYSSALRFGFVLLLLLPSQDAEILNTDSFSSILDRAGVVEERHAGITGVIALRSSPRYCLNSERE